jgi:cytochrome b561
MIRNIAGFMIFGRPLTVYMGLLTFILLVSTATIPTLNRRGLAKIPMKYHFWLARTTIGIAFIHGLLVSSLYLGF